MSFELQVQYQNWQNPENFALFDFKNEHKQWESIVLKETGLICRQKHPYKLIFVPEKIISEYKQDQARQPLFFVNKIEESFKITDMKNNKEPLLLLAHKQEQKNFKPIELQKGSRIKIGKIWVNLISVNVALREGKSFYDTSKSNIKIQGVKELKEENYYKESNIQNDKSLISQNPFCRFCYSKSIEGQNYMLVLCRCEGTTKYIHSQCLSQWISVRVDVNKEHRNNRNYVNSMSIASFQCEICKQYYPFEKVVNLLSKRKDQKFTNFHEIKQYLAFSVEMDYDHKIFIVNLDDKKQLQIGRQLFNEICVPDPSASRVHCFIRYNEELKQLVLFDCDSKFGTAIKKSSLIVNGSISLQKGRTILNIRKKEKKPFFKRLFMCSAE